jgi:hypothetical protein
MGQLPNTIDPETEELVCEILKAINGVRQAPRLWYRDFNANLTDANFGLTISRADPCLFFKRFGKNNLIILYFYIDDLPWFYDDNPETKAEALRMLSHIKYDLRDTTDKICLLTRKFLFLPLLNSYTKVYS